MNCTRCGRALKNASASGMGPKCQQAVLGSKPKRPRLFDLPARRSKDEKTPDLFAEASR